MKPVVIQMMVTLLIVQPNVSGTLRKVQKNAHAEKNAQVRVYYSSTESAFCSLTDQSVPQVDVRVRNTTVRKQQHHPVVLSHRKNQRIRTKIFILFEFENFYLNIFDLNIFDLLQNSVLLLRTTSDYSIGHLKTHLLTDASGREEYNIFFRVGDEANTKYSCTITFQNQHYVIGGYVSEQVTSNFWIIFCNSELLITCLKRNKLVVLKTAS